MTGATDPRFVTRDVPLGNGETLRIGLEWDRHGVPVLLHMALGIGTGRAWQECTEAGFAIPSDSTPDLVRALLPFLAPAQRPEVAS
jgi:hypothetical protein